MWAETCDVEKLWTVVHDSTISIYINPYPANVDNMASSYQC